MPEPFEAEFQAELARYEEEETMRYVSTIERMAKQEGRREEGRSLVLRLLTRRMGELPESVADQVSKLSVESLEELGEALLDFRGMENFDAWIASYPAQTRDAE